MEINFSPAKTKIAQSDLDNHLAFSHSHEFVAFIWSEEVDQT